VCCHIWNCHNVKPRSFYLSALTHRTLRNSSAHLGTKCRMTLDHFVMVRIHARQPLSDPLRMA
jgi:hypothetical protein